MPQIQCRASTAKSVPLLVPTVRYVFMGMCVFMYTDWCACMNTDSNCCRTCTCALRSVLGVSPRAYVILLTVVLSCRARMSMTQLSLSLSLYIQGNFDNSTLSLSLCLSLCLRTGRKRGVGEARLVCLRGVCAQQAHRTLWCSHTQAL